MAVVLISAKRVTNMKQVKKYIYEGNEAASKEKLTVTKICYPKRRLICKDNSLMYKFTFSLKFPYNFCAGMSNILQCLMILYWNPALPIGKKSIPQHLPNCVSFNVVLIAQIYVPILCPQSCQLWPSVCYS